jgi:peptidoglycan/xylan/chitin deacetylase (PgdA/CDA1 family)
VTYHGIVRSPLDVDNSCFLDEKSFRRQVTYLANYFDVVSLSEAIERMGNVRISRPTAVITFDDGYQNNYSIAFPILRAVNLPATIFLTTGLIDTEDTLWDLRLNRSLRDTTTRSLNWNGITLDLCGFEAKTRAKVEIRSRLKDLPSPLLSWQLRDVIRALGDCPERPIEIDSPFRMLNTGAIAEMVASGLIEFGAHSHTHPVLSRLSGEQCRDEIERSIKLVQNLTGRPCKLFAYPFGGGRDYNKQTVDILRSLGISAAVTTLPGPNDRNSSLLELRRYGVGSGEGMALFKLKVHHLRTWGSPNN